MRSVIDVTGSLTVPILDLDDAFARPYRASDAAMLHEAVNETAESLAAWLDWYRPDYALADAEQWIAHCTKGRESGDLYVFALFDAADERFLGAVGISQRDRLRNAAGIGYWIRASARGRGLAARLGREVATFGFRHVNLARIEIVAATHNIASRRTAEKIGARFEGVRHDHLRVGNRMLDAAVYALAPAEQASTR